VHSGVCGGIFGISLSFWIVEDLTQNPGRFKLVIARAISGLRIE